MTIRTGIAAAVLACLACVPVAVSTDTAVIDAPVRVAVTVTDTSVCTVPTVDNGACRPGGRFRIGARMTPGRITLSDNYTRTTN